MRSEQRTRVLFIAGAGRSGSTLLDRLLGTTAGMVSIGEIFHVWDDGLRKPEHLCSCGAVFRACPFWTEVFGAAFGGFDGVDAARVSASERDLMLWRTAGRIARFGPPGGRTGRHFAELASVVERLYAAIARVSGADVVVDSSKYPTYLYLLMRMPSLDVRCVHLVRDSRAVAHSFARRAQAALASGGRPRPLASLGVAGMAYYWGTANLLAEGARLAGCPSIRVRYDDLATDPAGTVDRVRAFAGLAQPGLAAGSHEVELPCQHLADGNQMRSVRGRVAIRPDEEWRMAMRRRDRLAVTAMTWALLLRYRGRRAEGRGLALPVD